MAGYKLTGASAKKLKVLFNQPIGGDDQDVKGRGTSRYDIHVRITGDKDTGTGLYPCVPTYLDTDTDTWVEFEEQRCKGSNNRKLAVDERYRAINYGEVTDGGTDYLFFSVDERPGLLEGCGVIISVVPDENGDDVYLFEVDVDSLAGCNLKLEDSSGSGSGDDCPRLAVDVDSLAGCGHVVQEPEEEGGCPKLAQDQERYEPNDIILDIPGEIVLSGGGCEVQLDFDITTYRIERNKCGTLVFWRNIATEHITQIVDIGCCCTSSSSSSTPSSSSSPRPSSSSPRPSSSSIGYSSSYYTSSTSSVTTGCPGSCQWHWSGASWLWDAYIGCDTGCGCTAYPSGTGSVEGELAYTPCGGGVIPGSGCACGETDNGCGTQTWTWHGGEWVADVITCTCGFSVLPCFRGTLEGETTTNNCCVEDTVSMAMADHRGWHPTEIAAYYSDKAQPKPIPYPQENYVLSLPRRTDRRQQVQEQFAKAGLKYQLVDAVDGEQTTPPETWVAPRGAWGCRLSHMAVLDEASLRGLQVIAVYEDDVVFVDDFNLKLHDLIRDVERVDPDWQGIMLGGQHTTKPPVETSNPNVLRCQDCRRTHAYIVRKPYIKALYNTFRDNQVEHIDWAWGHRQPGDRVYCPREFLAFQGAGHSDITGRVRGLRTWQPRKIDKPGGCTKCRKKEGK